jgi:hypothetical protein
MPSPYDEALSLLKGRVGQDAVAARLKAQGLESQAVEMVLHAAKPHLGSAEPLDATTSPPTPVAESEIGTRTLVCRALSRMAVVKLLSRLGLT